MSIASERLRVVSGNLSPFMPSTLGAKVENDFRLVGVVMTTDDGLAARPSAN